MAGNIKGITIEFRGDTTSLDKALRKVKNDTKGIDSELRKVNNALKFNPKNVELLTQKQTLLRQRVKQTETSLRELKNVQAQMDAKGVDKNSEEYRTLRREIITTESKLKHFTGELQKVSAAASKVGQVGQKFEDMGAKITKAGQSLRRFSMISAAAAAGIGAITYKAAVAADDINTMSKQYGISTHDLQMYAASADLVDVSVETLAKTHSKLKRNMLTASEGTGAAADAFKALGIDVTDANGELRDGNKVYDEAIAALGKMENETQRDAYAMAIFGKSAAELNPLIEDGGATYAKVAKIMEENGLEPVDQEALDRANEFNDQIDTIKLVMTQAIQIIGTKIAGYLLPIMEKVTEKFTAFASKIAEFSGGTLAKLGGLSAIGAALSPVLIIIGKLTTGFGKMLKNVALAAQKFPALGKALMFLKANPIILVATALLGLVAAIGKTGMSGKELAKKIEKAIDNISKIIPEVVEKVVEVIKEVGKTLAKSVPVILKGAVTLFEALAEAVPKVIPKVIKALSDLLDKIAKKLPTFIGTLTNAAVNLFTSIANAIPKVVPKVLNAIVNLVNSVVQKLPTFISSLLNAAVSLFTAIANAIPKVLPKALSALTSLIGTVIRKLPSFAASLLSAAFNLFMNLVKAIPQVVPKLVAALPQIGNAMVKYFKGLWSSIKGVFGNVAGWFGEKFSGAWSAIKQKFAGWGAFWSGLWTSVRNKFSSIGSSIGNAMTGAIKRGINGVLGIVEGAINKGIGLINKALDLADAIVPGKHNWHINEVSFPRLAKGGIVDEATIAMIGEGKSAEAVIPLDELWKRMDKMTANIGGGGDAITINVYGAEGQSVQAIAEAVERKLIAAQNRRRKAWA